uniref:DUF5801 repeats-in-toxin domain-containing protein n=1 Tax=Pseudomonas donghuensis TaxID=1163398 RepID=UPI0021D52F78
MDETVLATNATQNFAANFTSAFGADGAGTLTYALGVVAGASGLTDSATGEAVNLSLNGGVVEGRTATTNQLVLTVSVAANGDVTLDQLRAVIHPDATNPDDSTSLASDNLVTLTATKGLNISLVNGQFTLVRPDNTTTTGTGTLTELVPSPDVNGAYQFAGTLTGDFDNNAATADTTVDYTLTAF